MLSAGSFGQRKIVERNSFAQRDQAISKADLDQLFSVDDLIERPSRGASLLGQRLPLIDREAEEVGFEGFHRPDNT